MWDGERNAEHERRMWEEIRARFGSRFDGDFLDVVDDYWVEIQTAMYTRPTG